MYECLVCDRICDIIVELLVLFDNYLGVERVWKYRMFLRENWVINWKENVIWICIFNLGREKKNGFFFFIFEDRMMYVNIWCYVNFNW